MRNVLAVQDLQFGSTGKGQIAGSIADVWGPDTVVTAWGPNAGHTFRRGDEKYVSTMLATSAICPTVGQILIGPGSVINLDSLRDEIFERAEFLQGKMLAIHPQAVVVKESHRQLEATELLSIGSTMKGTGAALTDKVMRQTVTVRDNYKTVMDKLGEAVMKSDMSLSLSSRVYDRAVDVSGRMMIEGAQGFSLGYHNDFYPHTTSRDVSTAQLIADCRLPFPGGDHAFAVLGVCRSFPIRVANRERDGVKYSSGGCYSDQRELDWANDLSREPELTTVTRLPRRIFSFSFEQIIEACRIMAPSALALTFCDYLMPGAPDGEIVVMPDEIVVVPEKVQALADQIQQVTGVYVYLMSFGPTTKDVRELDDNNNLQPLSGKFLFGGNHD